LSCAGRPSGSHLLPYTTLFRSAQRAGRRFSVICAESRPVFEGRQTAAALASYGIPVRLVVDAAAMHAVAEAQMVLVGADLHHLRSEEHTSELQSRENLVCRLLL